MSSKILNWRDKYEPEAINYFMNQYQGKNLYRMISPSGQLSWVAQSYYMRNILGIRPTYHMRTQRTMVQVHEKLIGLKRIRDAKLEQKARQALIAHMGSLKDCMRYGYISKVDGRTVLAKGVNWFRNQTEDEITGKLIEYDDMDTSLTLKSQVKDYNESEYSTESASTTTASDSLDDIESAQDTPEIKYYSYPDQAPNDIEKILIVLYKANTEEGLKNIYKDKLADPNTGGVLEAGFLRVDNMQDSIQNKFLETYRKEYKGVRIVPFIDVKEKEKQIVKFRLHIYYPNPIEFSNTVKYIDFIFYG